MMAKQLKRWVLRQLFCRVDLHSIPLKLIELKCFQTYKDEWRKNGNSAFNVCEWCSKVQGPLHISGKSMLDEEFREWE